MARRARTSAFATPFVVVLGCGTPAPRTMTAEQIAAADPPIDAPVPIDAYADTSPDAAADAELDNVAAHCQGVLEPAWVCHPAKGSYWAEPRGNPPAPSPPLVMDIIDVRVVADAIEVTFNYGSDVGIREGMRGHMIQRDAQVVASSEFRVSSVRSDSSVARVKLPYDRVVELYGLLEPSR
jgi:hypothetical protein